MQGSGVWTQVWNAPGGRAWEGQHRLSSPVSVSLLQQPSVVYSGRVFLRVTQDQLCPTPDLWGLSLGTCPGNLDFS